MRGAIEVRRLEASDASLASEAIHEIKWAGESNDPISLDFHGFRLWLEKPANVLIVAQEDAHPVGFALGYILD